VFDFRNGPAIVLAGAVRTPIGKFGGALSSLTAVELATVAAREALRRSGVPPEALDETIIGHGRQANCGPNPGRQISVAAGVPHEVPAYTVNQACASGLKSVILAAQTIALGAADAVLAGGTESMSNTPYMLPQARWGYRMGNSKVIDGMFRDGFLCPLCGVLMGRTAENLAERYDISREEQDRYAMHTQHLAQAAWEAGRFAAEIVPVEVPQRKGDALVLDTDEHPRADVTMEQLAKLPAVFKEDGTVHAGNASGVTDGAAALVVMSESAAQEHGVQPMARLIGAAQAGVDPAFMGIGPVPATRELLAGLELDLADIDLIELNEAFAAQAIAVDRELHLDPEKVNVNGGAIALGHPIGCTGTRILTTLLHEMERRDVRRGLATLCVSGGMGTTLVVERP